MARWKHLKSGGLYRRLPLQLKLESTGEAMVAYQSVETGQHWVRPLVEFKEKFELVPDPIEQRVRDAIDARDAPRTDELIVHRGRLV